jgi:hypothetical protein
LSVPSSVRWVPLAICIRSAATTGLIYYPRAVHRATVANLEKLGKRGSEGTLGIIQCYHLYGQSTTYWHLVEVIVPIGPSWQASSYIFLDIIRVIIIIVVLGGCLWSLIFLLLHSIMIDIGHV